MAVRGIADKSAQQGRLFSVHIYGARVLVAEESSRESRAAACPLEIAHPRHDYFSPIG